MALSGSSYKAFARHRLVLEWSATQSVPENNSRVTTKVYLQSMDGYGDMYAPVVNNGSVTVNGQTQTFRASSELRAYQKKLLGTNTFVVPHNSDGSKVFNFSATFYINVTFAGVFYGNQTTSGAGTLNTIPRASAITLSRNDIRFGDTISISINRASSAFTHSLSFKWYSTQDTVIATKTTATSVSFTTSTSLASAIPNASSGWGTVICDTYSGNTKIGTSSARLTITSSSNAMFAPVITDFFAWGQSEEVSNKFGDIYLQGKTRLLLSITASYKNGATHKSTVTKVGNYQTVNGSSAYSGVLLETGNIDLTTTVTDSRGYTDTKTKTIYVVPYKNPSVNFFEANRREGKQETVDFSWNCSTTPVNGKNNMGVKILYRTVGVANWTTLKTYANAYDSSWVGSIGFTGFDVGIPYEFKIEVFDSLMTVSSTTNVPTATVPMAWGKTGSSVGKVYEEGKEAFQVRGKSKFEGAINVSEGDVTVDKGIVYGQLRTRELSSSQGGGLNLMDSDVIKMKGLYFGQKLDNRYKGMFFPNSKISWDTLNSMEFIPEEDQWDRLSVLDGVGYLNGVPIFTDKGNLGQAIWTGAAHMRATDTLKMSPALTECPHGWLLKWEAWDTGGKQGVNFVYTVLHKAQEGRGGGVNVGLGINDVFTRKYIYARNKGELAGSAYNWDNANSRKLVLSEVYVW